MQLFKLSDLRMHGVFSSKISNRWWGGIHSQSWGALCYTLFAPKVIENAAHKYRCADCFSWGMPGLWRIPWTIAVPDYFLVCKSKLSDGWKLKRWFQEMLYTPIFLTTSVSLPHILSAITAVWEMFKPFTVNRSFSYELPCYVLYITSGK